MAESRQGELTEVQKERLRTIQEVLKIRIDGDWDEEMIQTAFDYLERFLLGEAAGPDTPQPRPKPSRSRARSKPQKQAPKK